MPRARGQGRGGGRVRPHQRETQDDTAIIGEDLELSLEHQVSVQETLSSDMKDATRKDMRNRIRHVYVWIEAKYPAYALNGVRNLTDVELSGQDVFWYNNKKDFVYTGMNAKMITAFLSEKKKKLSGQSSSYVQIRKYHDAIVYGSKQAQEPLPAKYYHTMDRYLYAYKKECVDARKNGKLDEQEADPISWALFRTILGWALKEDNLFVWVFSILQWNCMARSVNIGVLAFHNFRPGEDNIVCKYDRSKMDQTGEKAHGKHLYANPFDPLVCCYLALGVWFSVEASWFEFTENFFQKDGSKEQSASTRYCTQLAEIFKKYRDQLGSFIRVDHANTHGIRKGSGTTASSGTTCPPPVSSIAARGEWSLGKVLDLYWHFCAPGDQYLGRCLAGLDPNSPNFATLPPHFMLEDPMANDDIREAMLLMFGTILKRWGGTAVDPTPLLLRCLAAVIYHADWLLNIAAENPGHRFSTIPILNNRPLLDRLRLIVSCESGGVMTRATGIPPHIEQIVMTRKVLGMCVDTLEEVRNMSEKIQEAVSIAFEAKALENGQLTGDRLKDLLQEQQQDIKDYVFLQLKEIRRGVPPENIEEENNAVVVLDGDADEGEQQDVNVHPTYRPRSYCHNGKLGWAVPDPFELPTQMSLEKGWQLWLVGLPGYEVVKADRLRVGAPVRPFRKFRSDTVPKAMYKKWLSYWKPVLSLMEEAPSMGQLRENPAAIDAQYLQETLEKGKAFLRTRVSYIFAKPKAKPGTWDISTWSKHVQRSSILKNGTPEDIAHLPPAGRYNSSRVARRRRITQPATNRRTRQRVSNNNNNNNANNAEAPTAAAAATTEPPPPAPAELPDFTNALTGRAQALGRVIEQQTRLEMADDLRTIDRANRGGEPVPDGHGGVLIAGRPQQTTARNINDRGYEEWLDDQMEDE
jgi:hypothetical protein